MGITPTSQAAGVGSSVENQPFAVTAQVVPRKIVIVGTYDPAKTDIVPNKLIQVFSADQVGALTGFGYMLHRLAEQAYKGSRGIETWIIPQLEDVAGTQGAGNITFFGIATTGGIIHLYIGGILDRPVNISVPPAATAVEICELVVTAINAIKELPVTAAQNATPEICDITAKTKGLLWSLGITIAFNRKSGESLPPGVLISITQLFGGAATFDIQPALDELGTGDNANEKQFTDFIHGYQDIEAYDAIMNYVGPGDTKTGLYSELVHKPFQTIFGSKAVDEAGLAILVNLANDRKETDRATGIIGVPGSYSIPEEIGAQAMGHRARIANVRPEENYVDIILEGIDPGDPVGRWTNSYDNRDLAVKNGISPTIVRNNIVYMQNLVTFYHPDSVPAASNGYASLRDLAIIQNLLDSQYKTFNTEKWKNFTIVADVTKVSDVEARKKARDIDSVIDECVALIIAWLGNAWIYEKEYSIQQLALPGAVIIRAGTDGFDINSKLILSGKGNIMNVNTIFDTSIAVLNQ